MSDILKKALEGELFETNGAGPGPITPGPSLRGRLVESATLEGRLTRFAAEAAAILDLPLAEAEQLLNQVDAPGSFGPELPGVEFFWLPGGPRVANAVRGFVRVDRDAVLPEHEHLGAEEVLVLQGIYIDTRSGERFGPGSRLHGDAGTTHEFRPDDKGTDLLLLIVVDVGYRIGDLLVEPRD